MSDMANDSADFLALKATLSQHKNIRWDEVYRLRSDQFALYPTIAAHTVDAFLWLEGQPEGQRLFREIVAKPQRKDRVNVDAVHGDAGSGFSYESTSDTINIYVADLGEKAKLAQLASMISTGRSTQDLFRIALAHESDHAVNSPPLIADLAKRRCLEAQAVERELPFRQRLGLPPRRGYADPIANLRAGAPQSEIGNAQNVARATVAFNAGCAALEPSAMALQAEVLAQRIHEELATSRDQLANPAPVATSNSAAAAATIVPQTTSPIKPSRSGPAM
jgi:hypothetical protein